MDNDGAAHSASTIKRVGLSLTPPSELAHWSRMVEDKSRNQATEALDQLIKGALVNRTPNTTLVW